MEEVDGASLVGSGEAAFVGVWPCIAVLVGVVVGVPLVGGSEATLVWPCVIVLVGIVDGVLLVGSGEAMLVVGVWPFVTVLVKVGNEVPLVGSGEAVLVGVWLCITVLVEVEAGLPLVDDSEATLVGVWPSVTLLLVSGVATSEGVGLPVSSTVLVLLVVLGPVKCVRYIHTYVRMWQPFCKDV